MGSCRMSFWPTSFEYLTIAPSSEIRFTRKVEVEVLCNSLDLVLLWLERNRYYYPGRGSQDTAHRNAAWVALRPRRRATDLPNSS